jgi:hypothetical protein
VVLTLELFVSYLLSSIGFFLSDKFPPCGGKSGHSVTLTTKEESHWAPVAHTCNPSFSGGRDQKDLGLKPTWANSSGDPI